MRLEKMRLRTAAAAPPLPTYTFALSVFTLMHHPRYTTIPVLWWCVFVVVFLLQILFSLCTHTCAGMLPVAKFSLRCLCLWCTGSVGIARAKIKDNKRRIVFPSNLHSGMWLLQFHWLLFFAGAMLALQPLR